MGHVPDGYKYYRREFLNDPGQCTVGFVLASVDKRDYCEFRIGDCGRIVSLEIRMDSDSKESEIINSIKKLDRIANACKELSSIIKKSARKRGINWEDQ